MPWHPRRRCAVHSIYQGLVQLTEIFDDEVGVILADPHFGQRSGLVSAIRRSVLSRLRNATGRERERDEMREMDQIE